MERLFHPNELTAWRGSAVNLAEEGDTVSRSGVTPTLVPMPNGDVLFWFMPARPAPEAAPCPLVQARRSNLLPEAMQESVFSVLRSMMALGFIFVLPWGALILFWHHGPRSVWQGTLFLYAPTVMLTLSHAPDPLMMAAAAALLGVATPPLYVVYLIYKAAKALSEL